MLHTSIEAIVKQVLVWYLPLVCCYFSWPLIRRRRPYLIALAVLCLTPVFDCYPLLDSWPKYPHYADWFRPIAPLIIGLPGTVLQLPDGLMQFAYMSLPAGVVVGVLAWRLADQFLAPGASQELHKPQASLSWPRAFALRMRTLLFLLLATAAYVELWYLPLEFLAFILQ